MQSSRSPRARSSDGGADRRVRKELLSDYCVDGVISLPAGAFGPYTGVKTSLLLFRREKAEPVVRFLQVDEWPSPRPGDVIDREKAIAHAHRVAEEFKAGTPNGTLWESPVKKLAARDWELVAKRTGEEALARSLDRLREADPSIPLQQLDALAEVFTGVSYGKDVTTTNGEDPAVFAGLLRVGDVHHTEVRHPSLFLKEEGSARVDSKNQLRAGDILITVSGTIGKLGVVSDQGGTVGSVATKSIAVVRPREPIAPRFITALLRSSAYQDWFRGHARGATIQHLSVRTLRNLPVPVPELPIQERLVRHSR